VEGELPIRLVEVFGLGLGPWVLACFLVRQFALREASHAFIEEVLRPVFRVWGSRLSKALGVDKEGMR